MHLVGGTLGPMYDSLTSGPSGTAPIKSRKERKLSLLLRRTAEPVHCGGVESLALSSDGNSLFTASRDATVRSWKAQGSETGQWQATFEGHSDWVNDIVTVQDAVVSCSSDRSISIWRADAEGIAKPDAAMYSHTDYVTCLAAARDAPVVISGGLRGQVMLWDVPTTVAALQQGTAFRSIDQGSPLGSVYALDINPQGNMVAVGSPEGLIRISDSRTAAKSFKLRGHTDNIRALILNEEGTLAFSASSDHTVRLWDLGQQRSVHTFAVHTDSVWTLWAPPDFSVVYSGGRDNCVYRTHVASRGSELLFEERAPVNKILIGNDGRLWCATTESSVRCWKLPAADWNTSGGHLTPASPRTPSRASGRVFFAGPSPQIRQRWRFPQDDSLRSSFTTAFQHPQSQAGGIHHKSKGIERELPHSVLPGAKPEAAESEVQHEIRGIPPLKRFRTLLDRRHVLTQDAADQVALWDLACAAVVQEFGKVDMLEKERELFQPESIASWFTADVKLGSLAIHLELPTCFSAEVYARDLGRQDSPDDLKYNYGENLLKAALGKWVSGLGALYVASGSANGAGPSDLAGAASCFQLQAGVPPLIISSLQSDSHRFWTKAANEFTGSEQIGEIIPKWAADAVLYHRYPAAPDLKCAFVLIPAEGSGLPSLLQSRLNAPRILKILKVASYVVGKLADEGLSLTPHPLYYERQAQAQVERAAAAASTSPADAQELELVCNGQAVPLDLSLAAVRAFLWRRSDSVTMHFRVFNPSKPAPFPTIKPP